MIIKFINYDFNNRFNNQKKPSNSEGFFMFYCKGCSKLLI